MQCWLSVGISQFGEGPPGGGMSVMGQVDMNTLYQDMDLR